MEGSPPPHLGPLTFIDLRDREASYRWCSTKRRTRSRTRAKELRNEHVIAVVGKVVMRDKQQVNLKIKSGRIK
jgi:aspartyl-tRNA synthetase